MHEILPKFVGTNSGSSSAVIAALSRVKKSTASKTKLDLSAQERLAIEKNSQAKPITHDRKGSPNLVSFRRRGAARSARRSSAVERQIDLTPCSAAKSEADLSRTARPASVYPSYLKARRTILEESYREAKKSGKQWWGTEETRLQEYICKETSFERVQEGPKLRNNPSQYWIILNPFKKTEPAGAPLHAIAEEKSHKINMRATVTFLTTPTADTPGTTLVLQFDNRHYVIGNVGEGVQRAFLQRGARIMKTWHLFITGMTNWHSVGGTIGMVLTLADIISHKKESISKSRPGWTNQSSDVPKALTLHGAKNLTHFLATTRRFVFRKGMPVEANEITEESDAKRKEGDFSPTWKDENVMVWAMPISPEVSLRHGRKRSYDMLEEEVTTNSKEATEEEESTNNQIRRGVVSHMFNSDWHLDALKKIRLADVQLPAAIFQRDSEGKIVEYNGPLPGGSGVVPDIEVFVRNPWPGAMIETLPPTTPSMSSVCYIFKLYHQRGKFDPRKAIELGVKPGPDFRKLTQGNSVTTADGTIVTPKMVLGKGRKGPGIAVVELPTRSYIDNLISRKEWSCEPIMDGLESIVWILGKGVFGDEKLLNFMREHAKLRHEISSPDICSNYLALESPSTAAVKLNVLDPERFPVPAHDSDAPPDTQTNNGLYNRAQVGIAFELVPNFKVDTDKLLPTFDTAKVVNDFPQDVLELANEARKIVNDPAYLAKLDELQKDLPGKDVEVIALGTGSALPSKYRNVSSTMIRVPGYGSYLLDCGENTMGQLKRVFGAELPQVLRDLKVIWISHLHADHHLGTVAVIKAFHDEMSSHDPTSTNKLMVASDEAMHDFLDEYAEIEDYGHYRIDHLYINRVPNQHATFTPSQTSSYGISSIQACRVDHCRGAFAVVFTFPHGFKVAYSGDCRPSKNFAKIGKGATLLIHEATFDDDLADEAAMKKHCTTSEALDVGSRMGAHRILLTHFSQRYPKIPVLDGTNMNEPSTSVESKEDSGGKVEAEGGDGGESQIAVVAFDYMRCLVGDLAKVAAFRPALAKLYEEENK